MKIDSTSQYHVERIGSLLGNIYSAGLREKDVFDYLKISKMFWWNLKNNKAGVSINLCLTQVEVYVSRINDEVDLKESYSTRVWNKTVGKMTALIYSARIKEADVYEQVGISRPTWLQFKYGDLSKNRMQYVFDQAKKIIMQNLDEVRCKAGYVQIIE